MPSFCLFFSVLCMFTLAISYSTHASAPCSSYNNTRSKLIFVCCIYLLQTSFAGLFLQYFHLPPHLITYHRAFYKLSLNEAAITKILLLMILLMKNFFSDNSTYSSPYSPSVRLSSSLLLSNIVFMPHIDAALQWAFHIFS